MGLPPLKMDKAFRVFKVLEKSKQERQVAQARLASRFAHAINRGDSEETKRVLDEMDAWNIIWGAQGRPDMMFDPERSIMQRLKPQVGRPAEVAREMELRKAYGF